MRTQFSIIILVISLSIFVQALQITIQKQKDININPSIDHSFGHRTSWDPAKKNTPIDPTLTFQKGQAINDDLVNSIKKWSQQAYILFKNDYGQNVDFLYSKIQQQYPGTWYINIFYQPQGDQTVNYGKDFGLSTYSINGTWWLFWKGVNHYEPQHIYFLSRMDTEPSSKVSKACLYNAIKIYKSTYTFKLVVLDVQQNNRGISLIDQAEQVNQKILPYAAQTPPNIYVGKDILFYSCQWGTGAANYIPLSVLNKFNITSFPIIGD